MRGIVSLPKIILKYLSKTFGLIQGKLLGEQLISLDESASTLGLKNWAKKEYR